MRFFKAIEIVEKPLIVWAKWADNIDQLIEMGEDENPLILPEELVPDFIYDVCPLKIVAGELVERTAPEMSTFATEFITQESLITQFALLSGINAGTFIFDMTTFPMDERSRLLYDALKNTSTAIPDTMIMNFEGKPYKLTEVNKADFLEAYYAKLLELSTPNFPV